LSRLSFRDRFYSPPVAHALTSPSAILATGVAAAAGVVVLSNPIGLAFGLVGYAVRVALAIPRPEKGPHIDPFAVQEPWRRFVQEAVAARRRYDEAVRTTRPGPLRDRLVEIGDRLAEGVESCWKTAQRANIIAKGRSQLDTEGPRRQLAELEAQAAAPGTNPDTRERTIAALRAQVATVERMDAVLRDALDRLRLLDARIDESVTRAVELSVQADSTDDLGDLGADIDGLASEMEALRVGLEESNRTTLGGDSGPGTAGGPEPGVA
jgi:hypothetical protein